MFTVSRRRVRQATSLSAVAACGQNSLIGLVSATFVPPVLVARRHSTSLGYQRHGSHKNRHGANHDDEAAEDGAEGGHNGGSGGEDVKHQPSATPTRITTPMKGGAAPEVTYFEAFDMSPVNYHRVLLEEAHKKHLVNRDVPPQLPPKIDPPNVPEPIFCDELKEFLRTAKLEYQPTHDPPPLRTTGVGNVLLDATSTVQLDKHLDSQRALDEGSAAAPTSPTPPSPTPPSPTSTGAAAEAPTADHSGGDHLVEVVITVEEDVEIEVEVDDESHHSTSAATTTTTASASASTNVQRAPVENDKKFHCSLCAKPFRLKLAAQHHMTAKHPEGGAQILEGPGPGEVIGWESGGGGGGGSSAGGIAGSGSGGAAAKQATRKKRVKKTVKKLVERRTTMKHSEALATKGAKIVNKRAVVVAAAPARPTAPSAAPADDAKPTLSSTATSRPAKAEATLPTEADIRELLDEIWDVHGKKQLGEKYKPSSEVVVGLADKRQPIDPDAPVKEAVSATPVGARRPEKKPLTAPRPGAQIVPIAVLSARFPNPFGDSAYIGDEVEDTLNTNPFLKATAVTPSQPSSSGADETKADGGEVAAASPPAPAAASKLDIATPATSRLPMPDPHAAARERRFKCSMCAADFRLIDGLRTHYNKKHGIEIPQDELRRCRAMTSSGWRYGITPAEKKSETTPSAAGLTQTTPSEGKADAIEAGATPDGGSGPSGSDDASDLATAPIAESEAAVHIRAASNIVLLGTVRDVKEGFIKADAVTQLVISVDGSGGAAAPEGGSDGTPVPPELVTVRVFGDGLKGQLREAKTGAQVVVQGVLKLNRRVDQVSKRSHAYPYVQVTFPVGSIHVVQ